MGKGIALLTALLLACSCTPAMADGSPPGSNDFTCTPSAAHPRPVVLVHGLGATQRLNWGYHAPKLHDAGYCVFSLTYGVDPRMVLFGYPGGTVRMEDSSAELAAFVDKVLAATGASKVDLVGHSEGTVMPRWYLEKRGGAAKVQKFVALTPLWRGTLSFLGMLRDAGGPVSDVVVRLVASLCGSCPQFITGSDYLDAVNADGEAVPGVEHTNIVTRFDQLVIPYTSGLMRDGGTNIVVQDVCPNDPYEHGGLAVDPVVTQLILNALDPQNANPVRC